MRYFTYISTDGKVIVYMEDRTLDKNINLISKDDIIPFYRKEDALSYIKGNFYGTMGNVLLN